MKTFLEDKLRHPYNKYCIDCKKNLSTHAILWLGLFVCKTCAEMHRVSFGGNQFSLVKDIHNEQWDDYQLRSICFGGNLQMFNLMKEFQIENHPFTSKYRHASVTWYRKRHVALMDGIQYDIEANPKPPKDWDERIAQTKSTLYKTST